ncbi:MAG: NUDIX hydrolase [Alphaproteobacteria bacterium]|nr:NUDIX hydrolase [Alphaproteobacteria bacterium]
MKASAASPRTAAAKKTSGIQYAALPYRVSEGTVEILLITSRRTRRWIIPKGWPVDGLQPPACAAREALEEAGISGEMEKRAIGHFRYFKHLRNGAGMSCKVDVFALKVTRERNAWAEKNDRERRWCMVADAAAAVAEPELRLMILKFGERMALPR